ncbi:T9SS type A sorting domain-containing protein [Chitinophagaceae bacterium MMS25-I14]
MKKLLSLCLAMVITMVAGAQTNVYVDSSIAVSGNGTSWPLAYKTLSQALQFTNSGGTTANYVINVARGTYYATGIQNSTNSDSSFAVTRGGVKILGGFPSGGGVRNINTNITILSGNIGSPADSDNTCHIITVSGIDSTADSLIIDGLNIVKGTARYNSQTGPDGGGLFLHNNNSRKMQISNCAFRWNYADEGGGGLFNETFLTISNCIFEQNKSGIGGGGLANTGTLKAFNCQFNNNTGGDSLISYGQAQGGGYYSTSTDSIYNCSFTQNTSYGAGGGYYFQSGAIAPVSILKGCTFAGNTARTYGGGASLENIYTDSCTFTGNSVFNSTGAITYGGGLYIRLWHIMLSPGTFTHSNITITRCMFTGNSAKYGGGAYAERGASIFSQGNIINLTSSSVYGNSGNSGGGLGLTGLICNVEYDIIAGNTSVSGGGIYESGASTRIYNSGFWGNKATSYGGAIYSDASYNGITFATFTGDTALIAGTTLYPVNASSLYKDTIRNSIIWDAGTNIYQQTSDVNYSIVRNGFPGTGNLNTDPLLISPMPASSAPTTLGNYKLQACSPAINAGYNGTASYTGVKDLAGMGRQYANTVDMGAYEYQAPDAMPLSGGDSVCINNTTQFSASVAGGTWSSLDPSIATVNSNGLVTGVSGGNATINYAVNAGTCIKNIQKHIYVTVINTSVVQNGAMLHASQPGVSYQWVNCNGNTPLAGETNQTFIATANGQYAVVITRNDCVDTSQCMTVTNAGVPSVGGPFVADIYPNPTSGSINIKTPVVLQNIRIADVTGKQLLNITPSGTEYRVDVSGLSTGAYLMEMISKEGMKQAVRISVIR